MGKKQNRIILLDADVISHFIVTNEILHLKTILTPHELVILDTVYHEATKLPKRKIIVDNWIGGSKISVLPFPANGDIRKEYFSIKKANPLIGEGERACMAVAKYDKNIIASSNFRDIIPYCKANSIDFLGTLDILILALEKGIFDEQRCNHFIINARNINHARFPLYVNNIGDYIPGNLNFMK